MSERLYMPHAGHFIGGASCAFHLNTLVSTAEGKRYIVSTVGEYRPSAVFEGDKLRARRDTDPPSEFGYHRLFETMVFPAVETKDECCPWSAESGENIDFEGYNERGDATRGHEAMCRKWEAPQ